MKYTLAALSLIFIMNTNSFAQSENKYQAPSEAEIAKNRECFRDLEVQGCRSVEEDPEQFRSCMSNAHQSLDEHCQKLMLNLYGN